MKMNRRKTGLQYIEMAWDYFVIAGSVWLIWLAFKGLFNV